MNIETFVGQLKRRVSGSGLSFKEDRFTRVPVYRVYRHGKAQPIGRVLAGGDEPDSSILVSMSARGLKVNAVTHAGLPIELPLNPSVSMAAEYLIKLDKVSRGRSPKPNRGAGPLAAWRAGFRRPGRHRLGALVKRLKRRTRRNRAKFGKGGTKWSVSKKKSIQSVPAQRAVEKALKAWREVKDRRSRR